MHYANGREAKVGDQVVGKTYNRPGIIAGTLVSLTPGEDNCSAMVGYLAVMPADVPSPNARIVALQGTEQHGQAGKLAATTYLEDYTHAGILLHADDVAKDGAKLGEIG